MWHKKLPVSRWFMFALLAVPLAGSCELSGPDDSLVAKASDGCGGGSYAQQMDETLADEYETPSKDPADQLTWFQLSTDDSTSMATAQLLKLDSESRFFFQYPLMPHEVVNYYDPPQTYRDVSGFSQHWQTEQGFFVGVDANRKQGETQDELELLIHTFAPLPPVAQRRPWTIHLCVDVSGSMNGSGQIDYVKTAIQRLVDFLQPGDQISLTTFSDRGQLVFASRDISTHETAIREAIGGLQAEGSTNMYEGLQLAYAEAQAAYDPSTTNRVLLFSDGDANVGDLAIEHYASLTRINNQEGIYLSGVGVGLFYMIERMNALTDAGKGAHIFLPSEDEVEVVFGRMLRKIIEVAADEVSIEVLMPAGFVLTSFSGEEYATDPEQRVPNTVLAAGDDMTMLVTFATDNPADFDREMVLIMRYRPLETGEPVEFRQTISISQILKAPGPLLQRTRLITDYAYWACEVDDTIDGQTLLDDLQAFPTDPGIAEVVGQVEHLMGQ